MIGELQDWQEFESSTVDCRLSIENFPIGGRMGSCCRESSLRS
jgi:hypothetical protein